MKDFTDQVVIDETINLMVEFMNYDITAAIDIYLMLLAAGINAIDAWKKWYDEVGSELNLDKLSAIAAIFDPYSYYYSSVVGRIDRFLSSREHCKKYANVVYGNMRRM